MSRIIHHNICVKKSTWKVSSVKLLSPDALSGCESRAYYVATLRDGNRAEVEGS